MSSRHPRNVARLRRLAAEQRELRAVRKTIAPSMPAVIHAAYVEATDPYGDVLLGLQTRDGFAPLCSEPLTAEEMAQSGAKRRLSRRLRRSA